MLGQGNYLLPIMTVLELVKRARQWNALFRQQIRLQNHPQTQLPGFWHRFRPGISAMIRRAELEILIDQLEKVVDQAKDMELEHLEAQQQLSVVKSSLRLFLSNAS